MRRKKSNTKKTKSKKRNVTKENKKEKLQNENREFVLSMIRRNNLNNDGVEWARKNLNLSYNISKREVINIACKQGLNL